MKKHLITMIGVWGFIVGMANLGEASPVISNGLVAAYEFSGNANDSIGNNHGTVSGVTLTKDRYGNNQSAYSFDGIDDYISIADSANNRMQDDFTLSLWFYSNESQIGLLAMKNGRYSSGNYAITVRDFAQQDGLNFTFENIYDDDWGVMMPGSPLANPNQTAANTVFNTAEWNHASFSKEGNTFKFYINGSCVSTQNWSFTQAVGNYDLNLGTGSGAYFGVYHFKGSIDDVSIYNRALSETEINSLYAAIPEPSIIVITPVNADGCVEATSPTGALIEASVGNFIDDPSIIYYWSNSGGAMTNGTNFVFELGINEDTIIFLTAEDTVSGEIASSFKQVRVSDTIPPDIIIISPEHGDTFTGNNLRLKVEINDVADSNITDYVVNVGSRASYPLDPETGTSHVKLSKPALGTEPVLTDITVSAKDASGNVSSATVQVKCRYDSRK